MSIQHSDKLMTFNQDYFSHGEGTFVLFRTMGSVSSSLIQWLFWKPRRLETLAHPTWQVPLNLGVRAPLLLCEAGTAEGLQTPSLLGASGQPWGAALTNAVLNPPLLPCDKSANLTWLFARCCVKRTMPWSTSWLRSIRKIVSWGEDDLLGGARRMYTEWLV